MPHKISLQVDDKIYGLEIDDPDMPLLYALRDELGFNNPRFGCGLAQCGACTVHVDGVAMRSCALPVGYLEGRAITTLKGLGSPARPHPLQTAWIEEQVNQCGYCINGWIMEGAALLARNPRPTEEEVRETFASLVCRCGTHNAALRAVMRVSSRA